MLLLILLLSLVHTFLYVVAVDILLRGAGFRATMGQIYMVLTASLAANHATPVKVGLPIRVYLYANLFSIPVSTGTALVAVETFIGFLLPAVISLIGIGVLFTNVSLLPPLAVVTSLLVLGGAVLLWRYPRDEQAASQSRFHTRLEKVFKFGREVRRGAKSISRTALVGFAFLCLATYVVSAFRLFFVLMFFEIWVNPLHLLYAHLISFTAGTLSMIPVGLGVRDASLTLLLVNLGVPLDAATATALIDRVFATGLMIVLGFVSAGLLRFRPAQEASTETRSGSAPG